MSTHCTLPLTLSSEQPNMLPEGFTMHTPSAGGRALDYVLAQEKAAKQSLNTIVFTAAVLLSPLWSMSQIPSVAINPILRIGAYAACISCLTALVIGSILRLRLKFIKQRQADNPLNMKARPTRKTIMSVSVVPLALLFSTIALFVFVLFGFTWDAGMEIPEDPADIRLTPDEQLLLALFGMAAFVSTCSTTVASFVPTRDECENEVTEKEDIY